MVHAVTAVTPSSREKWSLLWDARTTPSALSAVFAGMYIPSQNTHTILQVCILMMFMCTQKTKEERKNFILTYEF